VALAEKSGNLVTSSLVFHLVGMPNMPTQASRSLVHHTLGNGEFDLFGKWRNTLYARAQS
jgi:indolepyruvate decarboxylase